MQADLQTHITIEGENRDHNQLSSGSVLLSKDRAMSLQLENGVKNLVKNASEESMRPEVKHFLAKK